MKKKRYVIVGASARCRGMFLKNLVEKFADEVEVTGVYDVNRVLGQLDEDDPLLPIIEKALAKVAIYLCALLIRE